MSLTVLGIKNLVVKEKDYKLSDGKGLYLLIKTTGSKYWRMAYRFAGKQKTLALGVYPEVSLKQARDKRDAAKEILKSGSDPKAHADELKAQVIQEVKDGILFKEVVANWLTHKSHDYSPKTTKRNRGLIDNWINPHLGSIPASDVNANSILNMIRVIEAQGLRPTAHKVFAIVKMVFAYSIADPDIPIDRNWAVDIAGLLKPIEESHFPAMITPVEIGKLLASVAIAGSRWQTKLAMRLSLHWFIRPGELRNLTWDNVNWNMNCVQIKSEDMKKTKTVQEHWIPLSKQARAMLEFIKENDYQSKYVFPSSRNLSKPISENTVNVALKNMGFTGKQTAHGLRATARTLLEEELGENPTFIEHQLGHVVRDANGRAYNRTTMLDERRAMLQRWSDYLDDLEYRSVNNIEIKSKYELSLG